MNNLKSGYNRALMKAGIVTGILLLSVFPLFAETQVDCNTLPHWVQLDHHLKLNQKHVFCGEWSRNRPKGFHARPGGTNPETVAAFTVQDKTNAAGIYTGRWSYRDHPGKNKFSSMFPDDCDAVQVLNSIAYAIENTHQCPTGSPGWTQCGPNRPLYVDNNTNETVETVETVETATSYCSVNNRSFTIAFAPPRDGKVNTAFPLYE